MRAGRTGDGDGGAEGEAKDRGRGAGSPRSRTSRRCGASPPGIQQMPARHAHHYHQPIYNIDPEMGDLIPPQPPRPPINRPRILHGDAPHDNAPAAGMAAAPAARGSSQEPAPMAQQSKAEQAQGSNGPPPRPEKIGSGTGARSPTPSGGRSPPPGNGGIWVAELGHLGDQQGGDEPARRCRAPPETGRKREVPHGEPGGREDHKRVLWAVILAGWPDQGRGWPAFLEARAVLRVTDAEANVWLPLALRAALCHWRYRPRNRLPPQPQLPHKRRRARWPNPKTMARRAAGHASDPGRRTRGGLVRTDGPECPPRKAQDPRPWAAPAQPYGDDPAPSGRGLERRAGREGTNQRPGLLL